MKRKFFYEILFAYELVFLKAITCPLELSPLCEEFQAAWSFSRNLTDIRRIVHIGQISIPQSEARSIHASPIFYLFEFFCSWENQKLSTPLLAELWRSFIV